MFEKKRKLKAIFAYQLNLLKNARKIFKNVIISLVKKLSLDLRNDLIKMLFIVLC